MHLKAEFKILTLLRRNRYCIRNSCSMKSKLPRLIVPAFLCVLVYRKLTKHYKTSNTHTMLASLLSKELHPEFLFFNRVPKTGSELLAKLLLALAEQNKFVHKRYGSPQPRRLDEQDQKDFALKFVDELLPFSYDRHVYFLDFGNLTTHKRVPTWFSFVRHPVDKHVSRYSYMRPGKFKEGLDSNMNPIPENMTMEEFKTKNLETCIMSGDVECTYFLGQKYDLTIPYFCGQHDECMVLGSSWALKKAIFHVERYYPVIGVLEDLDITLKTLEKKLPRFFKGVNALYHDQLSEPHTNRNGRKQLPSEAAAKKLQTNLTLEVDFYNFIRQRLYAQAKQFAIRA